MKKEIPATELIIEVGITADPSQIKFKKGGQGEVFVSVNIPQIGTEKFAELSDEGQKKLIKLLQKGQHKKK